MSGLPPIDTNSGRESGSFRSSGLSSFRIDGGSATPKAGKSPKKNSFVARMLGLSPKAAVKSIVGKDDSREDE